MERLLSAAATVVLMTVIVVSINKFIPAFSNLHKKPASKNTQVPVWKYLWERLTDPLGYLEGICYQHPGPIVPFQSVPFIGRKLLLVNNAEVASLIYRKSRVLSLYPLVGNLIRPLSISLREYEGLNPNKDPTYPVIKQLEHVTHTAMAPALIHDMHTRGFKDDDSLVAALEDYKNDEPVLYLRFLRRLTAPKGYKALKKFQAAFTSYYDAGHVSQSSPVIQERYASYRKHWENPSIAAVEVMILQAAVMNFTSSVFWMLNFIFSDSELLKDVRGELEGICTVITTEPIIEASHSDEPQAKPKVATIDTNTLLASCPLIVSLWMETLRVTSCAVSSRRAVEDTVLEGGHAIHKGSTVNVIVAPMLRDPAIWGPDADDFVPDRFVSRNGETGRLELQPLKGVRRKAFLPFGGGASWCPGRHFVTHQVMFSVAAMVLGCEITGRDGSPVQRLELGRIKFFEGVRHPAGDLEVTIRRRKGFENMRFEAVVDPSAPMATLPF
ncbi:hypothetical protein NKR23_g8821 [Pleurostoma richardsiae]|uniref:Cytochrome P450 n=1 Tax=Pleurostoma richardsiae TaxID=41990 RepID=A0AA38RE06_9PEZI|nr:hypothetical protein NKR23_g8821 [Pleurostoma richardsiae]